MSRSSKTLGGRSNKNNVYKTSNNKKGNYTCERPRKICELMKMKWKLLEKKEKENYLK